MSPRVPPFTGLFAAPHTPLHEDGSLAPGRVPELAAWLARRGLRGVFVAGTTGEGPALTGEERRRLAEAWGAAAPEHGLRLIVQVGHASLEEACALARHAADCGAEAVAALPPFYYRPATLDALTDCCARIAEAAGDRPFLYYHIPAFTGVEIEPWRLLERAAERLPKLRGLKYTASDLSGLQRCLVTAGERGLDVLSGGDPTLLAALALGARGAIGSSYNFAALYAHRVFAGVRGGDLEAARRAQRRLARLVDLLAGFGYAAAAKATMGLLGLDLGPVRPPQPGLDAGARAALHAALAGEGYLDELVQLPAAT